MDGGIIGRYWQSGSPEDDRITPNIFYDTFLLFIQAPSFVENWKDKVW